MKPNIKILIAEDSLVNQKILLHMLRHFGWDADVVATGFGALQAVETCKYDIVFMDLFMPEMDGMEATRRIIDSHQPEERPKIIALTANSELDDKEKCFEAGMDDYITKPIRPEELQAVLERWVPISANYNLSSTQNETKKKVEVEVYEHRNIPEYSIAHV